MLKSYRLKLKNFEGTCGLEVMADSSSEHGFDAQRPKAAIVNTT